MRCAAACRDLRRDFCFCSSDRTCGTCTVFFATPAPVIKYVAPVPADAHFTFVPVIEHVTPAPVVSFTALAPVIENVTPEPGVTCATPVPVIEHVAPASVIECIAPAQPVTISSPSQQLPPAYTMYTTGLVNPPNSAAAVEEQLVAEETTQNTVEIRTQVQQLLLITLRSRRDGRLVSSSLG